MDERVLRVINYILYSIILGLLIYSLVSFARIKNDIALNGPEIASLEKQIEDLTNENRILKSHLEQNTDYGRLEAYMPGQASDGDQE